MMPCRSEAWMHSSSNPDTQVLQHIIDTLGLEYCLCSLTLTLGKISEAAQASRKSLHSSCCYENRCVVVEYVCLPGAKFSILVEGKLITLRCSFGFSDAPNLLV